MRSHGSTVYWTSISLNFFHHQPIVLAATPKGLCQILWPHRPFQELQKWVKKYLPNSQLIPDEEKLSSYVEQFQEYFQGIRQEFDIPFDVYGSPFQVQVWKKLCRIPFGQTRSYADIASAIGRPKAVRAVGTAIGANRIPILIPCHRVIGKNKTLTGFGGGLAIKKKLLHLEGYTDYIDKGHQRYNF